MPIASGHTNLVYQGHIFQNNVLWTSGLPSWIAFSNEPLYQIQPTNIQHIRPSKGWATFVVKVITKPNKLLRLHTIVMLTIAIKAPINQVAWTRFIPKRSTVYDTGASNIEIDDTKHDSSNYAPIDTKEMQEESMYDVDDLLMIDNDEEADIELKGGCSKKWYLTQS